MAADTQVRKTAPDTRLQTHSHTHSYRYTATDTQLHTHNYRYTTTHTQLQTHTYTHSYRYTATDTQLQTHTASDTQAKHTEARLHKATATRITTAVTCFVDGQPTCTCMYEATLRMYRGNTGNMQAKHCIEE